MGDLTGQRIDQTFEGLIKTEDEQSIEAGEKRLTDGIGNNLPVTVGALGMTYYGTQDFSNATVTGALGAKGEKGDTGAAGADGADGAAGAKGDKGDTGLTGTTGAKGDKGDTGADSTVPGPIGPQGDKGDTGLTGPQGDKGDKGAIGPSGGEKGEKGDTGAQGPQGVKGDKGDKGDIGLQGDKGDKGDKGDIGATGPTGASGITSIDINGQISYTSTAAITDYILACQLIPAGTFTTNDLLDLVGGIWLDNGGQTSPLKAKWEIYIEPNCPGAGNTQTPAGVRISNADGNLSSTSNWYSIVEKKLFVNSPNTQMGNRAFWPDTWADATVNGTGSAQANHYNQTPYWSDLNINWTVDQYLTIFITMPASGQTVRCDHLMLAKINS